MSQINDAFGRPLFEAMRGTPPPSWEQTCLKLSEEKRELQSDVNELKELVEYLQDHINLLKSTGDELLEWLKDGTISDSNYRLLANAWQRAKENKR
jgi:uncharacterized protein YlxW (UPF0749 family)